MLYLHHLCTFLLLFTSAICGFGCDNPLALSLRPPRTLHWQDCSQASLELISILSRDGSIGAAQDAHPVGNGEPGLLKFPRRSRHNTCLITAGHLNGSALVRTSLASLGGAIQLLIDHCVHDQHVGGKTVADGIVISIRQTGRLTGPEASLALKGIFPSTPIRPKYKFEGTRPFCESKSKKPSKMDWQDCAVASQLIFTGFSSRENTWDMERDFSHTSADGWRRLPRKERSGLCVIEVDLLLSHPSARTSLASIGGAMMSLMEECVHNQNIGGRIQTDDGISIVITNIQDINRFWVEYYAA
jgi:hypothetical protein